jgi:ribosome biogenesis GTPase A
MTNLPITRRPISAAQMKMVYTLARNQGMDDDVLHARVQAATGKEHVREMTCMEAAKLIDSLTGKDTSNRRRYDRPLNRASQEQINKIIALARRIGWMTDAEGHESYERLHGFLRARYHVERLDWLTPDSANRCVEALKAMAQRGYGERPTYEARR